MAGVIGIGHIVRLREMLRRWRTRAAASSAAASCALDAPADVPEGHVTVCAGSSPRRFAVPAAHLNHPVFRELLARAAEEYGFHRAGPLTVPCDEASLEDVLRHISSSPTSTFASPEDVIEVSSSPLCCCHVLLHRAESLPLLRGHGEKPVW